MKPLLGQKRDGQHMVFYTKHDRDRVNVYRVPLSEVWAWRNNESKWLVAVKDKEDVDV